ncbi:MAG: 16S rRNA (cytosine(1402)-N(4))-methyltransferase RsmH [Candidatus Omnitrophota bacterium]|nr:16S rRNA (cytosine(1402)-N(4))-methyltransferase RsmH [Candidatus Omnitrophota bacterium]MDZ4242769.1 16S rRNA (cytosine(1402)-N(4))-methyltransferase RsmH [Candidatus Omnitrophota bacterium]
MEGRDLHIPVMYREVLEWLRPSAGAFIVDCTLGLAGHSRMIVEMIGPQGRVIGIDRDKHSLALAAERLQQFSGQCDLVHDDFRHLDKILSARGVSQVDGILLDLGISSFQMDNPQRGFSFRSDGPLDMRMDQESYISAYDLVNSLSEQEIAAILRNFGEERWHSRIARYLVSHRPFQSTQELREAIVKAVPSSSLRQKIHPATRSFQAFRIAVNRELEALQITLERAADFLKPGGRICVISFHSLEDRIVKQQFRSWAQEGNFRVLTKKPIQPMEDEIVENPRARSAKLRAAEKI